MVQIRSVVVYMAVSCQDICVLNQHTEFHLPRGKNLQGAMLERTGNGTIQYSSGKSFPRKDVDIREAID